MEVCRRRSDAFDRAIRSLAANLTDGGAALAVGGYGRQELCPGSDVDLLFAHDPAREDSLRPVVDSVLYALWDAGFRVSHAIRTREESRLQAEFDLATLTSILDARLVAGDGSLWETTRSAGLAVARRDSGTFLARLANSREDRGRRFGELGAILEGDLRDALGGLRDAQVLRWCLAAGTMRTGPEGPVEESRDYLLLVRTALHRASGGRSNKLSAELHQAVADALAIEDEDGWEARDVLVRRVAVHSRRVRAAADSSCAAESTDAPDHDPASTRLFAFPEWAAVVGRPQRDPYHRSHVDTHLLATATRVRELLAGPHEAFTEEASKLVDQPEHLVLGALLHDIGKVGRGSHVSLGVELAERVLGRLAAPQSLRSDVLFLVGEHLLLADTATRRNLDDEDLILHVAARIGDERRLAMLYLLTLADAEATGPAASTPWRLSLIRELVGKVSRAFERGLMDAGRAARLEEAEALIRSTMIAAGRTPDEASAFLDAVPTGYALSVDPADAPSHASLVMTSFHTNEARIHVRPGGSFGTYRLSVGAIDRVGLLAAVAGALTLSGLSILSAQAYTTEGGMALDLFEVRSAFEDDVDDERWRRFRSTLSGALEGRIDLTERVQALQAHYRFAAQGIPITVRFDQSASDFYTVVEVGGPDRHGLLFELAQAFAGERADVHLAKVATYGPRVLDVFYVRDEAGEKLTDPKRVEALDRALREAAEVG